MGIGAWGMRLRSFFFFYCAHDIPHSWSSAFSCMFTVFLFNVYQYSVLQLWGFAAKCPCQTCNERCTLLVLVQYLAPIDFVRPFFLMCSQTYLSFRQLIHQSSCCYIYSPTIQKDGNRQVRELMVNIGLFNKTLWLDLPEGVYPSRS
jgi:hypothetical protein